MVRVYPNDYYVPWFYWTILSVESKQRAINSGDGNVNAISGSNKKSKAVENQEESSEEESEDEEDIADDDDDVSSINTSDISTDEEEEEKEEKNKIDEKKISSDDKDNGKDIHVDETEKKPEKGPSKPVVNIPVNRLEDVQVSIILYWMRSLNS